MARESLGEEIVEDIVTEDVDEALTDDDQAPLFQLIGSASIPVSKNAGKRWNNKIKAALEVYASERDIWSETFRMYRLTGDAQMAGSEHIYAHLFENDTDENILRENVKLLLRATYARNPSIEVSSTSKDKKDLAKCLELAVSALLNRKQNPGVNGKARLRRQIVHAHLTNFGIVKLNWQEKKGSQQEALQELYSLQKQLKDAKDIPEIEELYAKLEQVEDELPLHTPSGLGLTNLLPHKLIVDPECSSVDLSDCNWVAEEVWFKNEYIDDRFFEKSDDGKRIRKSDKKAKDAREDASTSASGDDIRNRVVATVIDATTEERQQYLEKGKVKCYLVWDRLTRQISLYEDGDWSYPLWVYEDNLLITRFFPHFIVSYSEPIDGIVQPGESSQYIGQQREINKINRKIAYIRDVAFGAIIYNSKIVKGETALRLIEHLKNPTRVEAFGIDWDTEMKLDDVLHSYVPPVAKYQELFDKTDLMKVANRISATNDAMKGEQFKTNTNTTAVNTYNQAANVTTSELTDIVEDAVEELGWALCEVLVSKFSKDEIIDLIGNEYGQHFTPMTAQELNREFALTVVAGSTEKPSSMQKKTEAMQIAQALGQVGQGAPLTTMRIIARMFGEAFSEFLFTTEDEQSLVTETEANMTKGATQPVGGGAPAQPVV